jgi:hypothetical protein
MCVSTGVAATRACFRRPAVCPRQTVWDRKSCSPGEQRFRATTRAKASPGADDQRHTRRYDTDICRDSFPALLVSPANRSLDSQAQSCGLSLPTFTRERIGIMSAHRIGLPGTRHAFARYHDPRLPVPRRRGGTRVPNGLAVPGPPQGRFASAGAARLAVAAGCGPPSDPSGARSQAGPAD